MDPLYPLLISAAGVTAIICLNWYSLWTARPRRDARFDGESAAREVEIQVDGGYRPNVIHAQKGVPLKLNFERRDTSRCSEEVVIGDFAIRKYLPAYARTSVTFTPVAAGSHELTCGTGMLRGRIEVGE